MKNVINIGATNRSLAAVGEAVDRSSFGTSSRDLPISNMFFNPVTGEMHMGVGCNYVDLDAINRVLEGIGEEVDEASLDDSEGIDFDAFNRMLDAIGEEVGPVSFGEVVPVVRLGCFDRDRDLRSAGYARN